MLLRPEPTQQRQRLVVILALTSGATDAIGFLALGDTFTSVMTGNMVLLGLHLARLDLVLSGLASLAILAFCVGAWLGARIAGKATPGDPTWPRAVTRALVVEFFLFLGFGIGWWLTGAEPAGWVIPVLLAANAMALGIQSSAIQRFGVSGLSTTYLTGTLTTIVMKLTHGDGFRAVSGSTALLVGLVAGAALATVLALTVPMAVPVFQLVTLGVAIAFAPRERESAAEQA